MDGELQDESWIKSTLILTIITNNLSNNCFRKVPKVYFLRGINIIYSAVGYKENELLSMLYLFTKIDLDDIFLYPIFWTCFYQQCNATCFSCYIIPMRIRRSDASGMPPTWINFWNQEFFTINIAIKYKKFIQIFCIILFTEYPMFNNEKWLKTKQKKYL